MVTISPETEEGRHFTGPQLTLSMERLLAFSGGPLGNPDWPAKNLHTDVGMAKEAGLPAPIASAIQYQGYLIRLLIDLFGEAWTHCGRLHVKYPRFVTAGERVRPKVRIRSKQQGDQSVAFEMDVWCENQDEEKVLVGTATCSLSLEPDSRN